jgi:hypothetical protein
LGETIRAAEETVAKRARAPCEQRVKIEDRPTPNESRL